MGKYVLKFVGEVVVLYFIYFFFYELDFGFGIFVYVMCNIMGVWDGLNFILLSFCGLENMLFLVNLD